MDIAHGQKRINNLYNIILQRFTACQLPPFIFPKLNQPGLRVQPNHSGFNVNAVKKIANTPEQHYL